MFDFRTLIAYLCTFSLALALGLAIGTSLVGPRQVAQQTQQLRDLRTQVDGAIDEGKKTKEQLGKMEDSIETMRPKLVHGKLANKRVVIIQTGDYPDARQAAESAVRDAGAIVAASVVINEKMNELTPAQRSDVLHTLPGGNADAAPDPPSQDSDTTRIIDAIADAVAEGTGTSKANRDALVTVESQGLITMTGDLSAPTLLCVLVGGGKDDASSGTVNTDPRKPVDGHLIDRLRESSGGLIRVAGCEPFSAIYPSIPIYQKYGIATVDCIDHPLGALDLPFALRGETADYGLGKAASRRVPASLEEIVSQ